MRARRLAGWTAAAVLALPAAALAAPASPDAGYGSGGTVATGVSASAAGMLLDSAGRAVLAARTGPSQTSLLRLSTAGALAPTTPAFGDGTESGLTALAEQPGSGYVAGGWVQQAPGGREFALARLDAAGNVVTPVADSLGGGAGEIRALAMQADGIVAVGPSGGVVRVARYTAAGTLQWSKTQSFTSVSSAEADGVVAAPGRIILAGTGVVAGERRFLVAALTPSGVIDPSFGGNGVVTLDVGDGAAAVRSLERQPDGKLLVAGTTDGGGAGGGVIARFMPDGTPDAGFSTDAVARLGIPNAVVQDVALQPDGKLVAAGEAGVDVVIDLFLPGGARDPGFGSDGVARRSFGSGADRLTGVGVAADGGIVAGGIGSGSVVATRLVGGDSSDPALAMTAESLGDLVTFTLTATNPGADPARDVRVTVAPPRAVAATALTTAGSVCAGVSCSLGTLPAGATRRMTLLARAKRPGALSATARIGAATFDSNPGNNFAGASATATRNRVVRRDRTRPKLKLRLRARRIKHVRKRVKLVIRTNERTTAVVRTRWVKRGRAHTFAKTRTVKLRGKRTKVVRLALTRAGRKHVKRKRTRRLELAVTVRARDRAGNKRKKTLRKTLHRRARR